MKTVLVVDDEMGSAEVLSLILEEEGYRTFCAVNGQRGLERAREVLPDLVVLDYMMPLMNGADLARRLRADPALAHVKIIMNSGLAEAAVREQFDGYDAFLRKPYNIDTVLKMIASLLAQD